MELENTVSVNDLEEDGTVGMDSAIDDLEDQADTKQSSRKYQTRRRIEDMLEFKRLRGEQGWMDDFDLDFEEVY